MALYNFLLMQQHTFHEIYQQILNGNFRSLARAISIVENEVPGYKELLYQITPNISTPIIGITGPPGAGKSTLVNALIGEILSNNKHIAIVAVDPSSPFNYGALLGDRIRLNAYYNNPNVYVRSLASRGSLGGLSNKIIEISDIIKAAPFDYIFVETVGVGQSEVEVAGLADTTVVVVVPEAGDEIQTMKAGIMEIADIFVVNKSDRADADRFVKNLRYLVHSRPASTWSIPVLKTVATKQEGISPLLEKINTHSQLPLQNQHRLQLLTRKAYQLIQTRRMKDVNTRQLQAAIAKAMQQASFNLYKFTEQM